MSIVFSRVASSVGWRGRVVQVSFDEPWDASDPFVTDHPEMFSSLPSRVARTGDVVEQATAGPGEKRATRRD